MIVGFYALCVFGHNGGICVCCLNFVLKVFIASRLSTKVRYFPLLVFVMKVE